MPLVSVCIPTYDRPQVLCRALDSVLRQTLQDFEIVVSFDAGPCDYAELIRNRYPDPRVRTVVQPSNLGILENFNACIGASSGAIVKPLCDDDELAPRCLEYAVEALHAAEFVSIDNVLWDGLGAYEWPETGPVEWIVRRRGLSPASLRVDCISPTNIAFTRRVWREAGPYRRAYGNSFDYDFTMRVYAEFDSVRIATPLCLFRRWELSETYKNTQPCEILCQLAAILEELAARYPEFRGNVSSRALRVGADLVVGFFVEARHGRYHWRELREGLHRVLRTQWRLLGGHRRAAAKADVSSDQ
jgi:glycosyltransferase involved in cell wall biosynthesis